MEALLDDLGISEPAEISYCDSTDIEAIAALLKPVPKRAFLKEISSYASSS